MEKKTEKEKEKKKGQHNDIVCEGEEVGQEPLAQSQGVDGSRPLPIFLCLSTIEMCGWHVRRVSVF